MTLSLERGETNLIEGSSGSLQLATVGLVDSGGFNDSGKPVQSVECV